MKRSIHTVCCVLLTACAGQAGVIQSGPAYLTNVTASPALVVNNNDYMGAFADNPNKAQINSQGSQSIGSIERIIPTASSGGSTEYAVSIGGSAQESNLNLNGIFQVQVGFGTGQNFVRALLVAPNLRFDTSGNVSPAVEDFRLFLGPFRNDLLTLISHSEDTLTFQGSSGVLNLSEYAGPEIFKFPLDVPDLNPSLREQFYTPAELANLPDGSVPFTFRTVAVPEPGGAILIVVGALTLFGITAARKRLSREPGLHTCRRLFHDSPKRKRFGRGACA